ncbi:hypothetical protein WA577_005698 [Blastocystis sp. JDR]
MESGVDLNRNFPVCFDVDEFGSSGRPCSDIYRGPFPLSESESQSFIRFLHSLRTTPTFAISLHAYGRSILHPFSCKSLAPTLNASSLLSFQQATKHLLHSISAKYTTGQAWNTPGLYTVNGDVVDYLWAKEGIPAVNIELPPDYPQSKDYLGFWPEEGYEAECVQLMMNGLELSRCNVIGTREGIRNEGFGRCVIEVNEGGNRLTRQLNPFEHLVLSSRTNEVRIGDRKRFYFWNETAGVFEEGQPVAEERMLLHYYRVEELSVKEAHRVVVVQIVVMWG